MAVDVQQIRGFVPGNALQIHRKVANPGKPDPVIEVTLHVISWQNVTLLEKTVRQNLSRIDPPPDDGFISNAGHAEPFVVDFRINIFADETEKLLGTPEYTITLKTHKGEHEVEIGTFLLDDPVVGFMAALLPVAPSENPLVVPGGPPQVTTFDDPLLPPPPSPPVVWPSPPPPPPLPVSPLPGPGDTGYESETAYVTYADACVTVGGRMEMIIDGFMDAVLGDYRQLKVWDEHARRVATDPLKLRLTYEYLNKYTTPEIFNGINEPVPFTDVDFDFRNGIFSVNGDDGKQDFFVTYTFNFFPEKALRMMVEQTVLEMNFIGAGAGSYATSYVSLEETPPTWDGPIALGATAKAWKKLATHTVLWRNWLIFEGDHGEGVNPPGGAAAQQAADSASQYYQSMFESVAAGTKWEKYVALPTDYWIMFSNTGFGKFGPLGPGNMVTQNSKFRGLTINKSGSYTY